MKDEKGLKENGTERANHGKNEKRKTGKREKTG